MKVVYSNCEGKPEVSEPSFAEWIIQFAQADHLWFVKRLAANDTLANKSHQAGPYLPKHVLLGAVPSLNDPQSRNPRKQLEAFIDSDSSVRHVTPIWYNNKLFGGTRNETRITRWGGAQSPLLDPERTGSIAVFVFTDAGKLDEASSLHVWVCSTDDEEELEDILGPIEPGIGVCWHPGFEPEFFTTQKTVGDCTLSADAIPPLWLKSFPTGAEIVAKTVEMRPAKGQRVDVRLTTRRSCEFQIFRSVEDAVEAPKIALGFNNLDSFLKLAQSIIQRRKSRSGRSLELHARAIFIEEGLIQGTDFDHSPKTEDGKEPDFLFPSAAAYHDPTYPASKLHMLGAKTTLRDRWRQVLNEADRIPVKHLLTLQEGVSLTQFSEMKKAGLKLVVPKSLHKSYKKEIRPELLNFEQFISIVRSKATL